MGVVSAVVISGNTLVDLGNAFALVIFIVTLVTFTDTIVAAGVARTCDTVALVF